MTLNIGRHTASDFENGGLFYLFSRTISAPHFHVQEKKIVLVDVV